MGLKLRVCECGVMGLFLPFSLRGGIFFLCLFFRPDKKLYLCKVFEACRQAACLFSFCDDKTHNNIYDSLKIKPTTLL